MSHVVIIGAGQAGASCCAKLRADGFDGEITVIGNEPVPPYQRPPLSKKYLLGEIEKERLFLRPESFYADQNITLRLGETVQSVLPETQEVITDQARYGYTDLVFATGARPRQLPADMGGDLAGVYVVRSLADVEAMAPEFRDGARVLIVGGGYIGLEAAAVAARRGLLVTVVEMGARILQRVAAEETSDFFNALHSENGVDLREGCGVEALLGDGRVRAVRLSGGEKIEVDFVIIGAGVLPNVEIAEAAGVDIENGIAVDAFGRSSQAHIWAAGDCASFPYQGARIRLESVPNAIEQAEAVAANIMGAEAPYAAKPWFWSDQYDVKLQIAGLNTGYDNVVVRTTADGESFWYYQGDRLLAVDAMNAPRDYMVGKRLIEAGKSPDRDAIADEATDLKALLRA